MWFIVFIKFGTFSAIISSSNVSVSQVSPVCLQSLVLHGYRELSSRSLVLLLQRLIFSSDTVGLSLPRGCVTQTSLLLVG